MGQVVTLEQLNKEIARRKDMSPRRPPRVVFTNGCFDILHVGHARYLRDARALGDLLVVGVNSDASVKRLKGPQRPVTSEDERAEMLAALAAVDYVVMFEEETPLALIEKVAPDVLVKGGDWPPEKIVGSTFVLARGGEVKSLPFHPGKSTTSILERIQKL
jgi:D-beta-D-heptose 7-phosphate kinase/D-beta-D-heptose 1-phosphate adenosyltransferase